MKILIHIVYLLFSFLYTGAEVSDEVIAAIRLGKASELVKYSDEKISVKIINQEDVLSKAQAEAALKYFFEKHPVRAFSSTHVSYVNNSSQYIAGNLETSAGKFRISILLRRNLISQFRIENDNE